MINTENQCNHCKNKSQKIKENQSQWKLMKIKKMKIYFECEGHSSIYGGVGGRGVSQLSERSSEEKYA